MFSAYGVGGLSQAIVWVLVAVTILSDCFYWVGSGGALRLPHNRKTSYIASIHPPKRVEAQVACMSAFGGKRK